MSLAPPLSVAAPAATRFNALPLYITLFCLLWSFAFIAGKVGVTYCPPLILLAARFSLAGVIILAISAFRREAWHLTWRDALVFAALALLWQIYSRCFCVPIQIWQYGHRRGLDRMMRSTMAWRMAGNVG